VIEHLCGNNISGFDTSNWEALSVPYTLLVNLDLKLQTGLFGLSKEALVYPINITSSFLTVVYFDISNFCYMGDKLKVVYEGRL